MDGRRNVVLCQCVTVSLYGHGGEDLIIADPLVVWEGLCTRCHDVAAGL
jgi:hypothetical protein